MIRESLVSSTLKQNRSLVRPHSIEIHINMGNARGQKAGWDKAIIIITLWLWNMLETSTVCWSSPGTQINDLFEEIHLRINALY